MAFAPACILQTLFQSYFVTAGHPGMGLGLMIIAGCTNAALDYVFIAAMHMGIAGAALATGIGQCIPAVAGVVFFLFTKKELRISPAADFILKKRQRQRSTGPPKCDRAVHCHYNLLI